MPGPNFRLVLQLDLGDGKSFDEPEEIHTDEIAFKANVKDSDAIFEDIQHAVALVLKCHGIKC